MPDRGDVPTAGPAGDRAAIGKAFGLLDVLGAAECDAVGVSELARRAGLPKSTAFRILEMLCRDDAVERVGNRYRLGPRLDTIVRPRRDEEDTLLEILTPHLVELHGRTGRTVHLAVLRRGHTVYLNKLHGPGRFPCPSRVGGRAPSYCTAVGKALLAYDADAAATVEARGLAAWTPRTLRGPDDLQRSLQRTRADALAVDDEEYRVGLSCVAVPVWGRGKRPLAAFSVAGAADGTDRNRDVAALRRVAHDSRRALLTFASARAHDVRRPRPGPVH